MKSGRLTVVNWLMAAVMIVLVAALVFVGCAKPAPTATPTPTSKTLKIGVVEWLGWPVGLDRVKATELMADVVNQKGGLDIAGEKYNIQLVIYDDKLDQASASAAINRLIYEDKVKFILGGSMLVNSYLATTEANKVVVVASTMSPEILLPDKHYSFEGVAMYGQTLAALRWFIDKYPDKKTFVFAFPDHEGGHAYGNFVPLIFRPYGLNATIEYYPPEAQDLSAVGTKVKSLNPDVFSVAGGGPILDGFAIKAARLAGYTGLIFAPEPVPAAILKQVADVSLLEGLVAQALPVEFEPPVTDAAKEFKDAYIAKYGKWDYPELRTFPVWSCLMVALQQAGSLDTDKVAAVIGSGLKYEDPSGSYQMVPRPDLGNNRTTDSAMSCYMKKIVGGEPTLIDTVSLDQAVNYFTDFFK